MVSSTPPRRNSLLSLVTLFVTSMLYRQPSGFLASMLGTGGSTSELLVNFALGFSPMLFFGETNGLKLSSSKKTNRNPINHGTLSVPLVRDFPALEIALLSPALLPDDVSITQGFGTEDCLDLKS